VSPRGRIALLAGAVALRAVHLACVLRSPIGATLVQDARYYHEEARRILEHGPSAGVSFMNLGYPFALAAIYAASGARAVAALAAQAVLGGVAALLVALAARRLLGSDTAAWIAGALYAAYSGAIFYDGLLLTPSLTNLALAAALWAATIHLDSGRILAAGLAGCALSVAILLRSNTLLLVPGLLAVAAAAWPLRLRAAAALLAGSLALPGAVVLANGLARGEWAPVSGNGGMNLWIGNNREAEGIYRAADFVTSQTAQAESRAFLSEARRRTGDYGMTVSGASAFWTREALREIAASPRRWLAILGRKAALFWNRYEAKTNVGMEFVAGFSPVLRWTPVRFGSLAVAGIGGIALLWAARRPAAAALLVVFVAAPFATCAAFFVSGEYRHPASLALAAGAAFLIERTARLGARAAAPGLIAAALTIPLVVWPFPALRLSCHPHLDFANHARQIATERPDGVHASEERVERGIALLDRAHASPPDDRIVLDARLWIETWGAVELRSDAWARRAVATARTLLSRDPRPDPESFPADLARKVADGIPACMTELLEQPFVRGDAGLARDVELAGGGGYAELHRLVEGGDLRGALAWADEALAIAPYHAGLQAAKGQILLAAGRETDGIALLRRSCEGWPELADCAVALGEHYAARGDRKSALAAAREALRREPASPRARQLLATLE
jgi:tetratricopeptide (TPR) repeat protein